MTPRKLPKVSVCICTYQRPAWLKHALESLRPSLSSGELAEIIVVDNDPAGSAADLVRASSFDGGIQLRYVHEPARNISTARNTALREASAEWIAFIDDDEFASPGWLGNLIATAERHDAAVALGPVVPAYGANVPAWVTRGAFFERRRHLTGTIVGWHDARTGNALFRKSLVASMTAPFSESFGLTGGEDSEFFRRLEQQGKKMVWCDEAIVYEHVPAERATTGWMLRRSFRTGQTWTRVTLASSAGGGVGRLASIAALAAARLVISVPMALLLAPISPSKSFRELRTLANRAGKLAALLGHSYEEY